MSLDKTIDVGVWFDIDGEHEVRTFTIPSSIFGNMTHAEFADSCIDIIGREIQNYKALPELDIEVIESIVE